jgi:hypothetical protein
MKSNAALSVDGNTLTQEAKKTQRVRAFLEKFSAEASPLAQ